MRDNSHLSSKAPVDTEKEVELMPQVHMPQVHAQVVYLNHVEYRQMERDVLEREVIGAFRFGFEHGRLHGWQVNAHARPRNA